MKDSPLYVLINRPSRKDFFLSTNNVVNGVLIRSLPPYSPSCSHLNCKEQNKILKIHYLHYVNIVVYKVRFCFGHHVLARVSWLYMQMVFVPNA